MKKFEIANRSSGLVLGVYDGDTAEEALLQAVADVGDWEVSVYDEQHAHPHTRHFESVHDALKIFVPEMIAHITEVE